MRLLGRTSRDIIGMANGSGFEFSPFQHQDKAALQGVGSQFVFFNCINRIVENRCIPLANMCV